MAVASETRTDAPAPRRSASPRDLSNLEEDRFLRYEMGRLTERLDGLKQSSQSTHHLQIAGIVVGLALAAFGAWGFSTQLAATNARIERLEEKLTQRLDRIDDQVRQVSDRVAKLEPRPAPAR